MKESDLEKNISKNQNTTRKENSMKSFTKKELKSILEAKGEESSLKISPQTKESNPESFQIKAKEEYHNMDEYLNESIKPIAFMTINISSKSAHSENQNYINNNNSETNISG